MKSKYLHINPQTGRIEYTDELSTDERLIRNICAAPGIDWTGYHCFQQTSVPHNETSHAIIDTMQEACRLGKMARLRYMTDALYLTGFCNTNRSIMTSLFVNREVFHHFSHGLADIIDQQERADFFNEEMSPMFIRQFEDANIIRKVRNAEKMQISDVMQAILYSDSSVAELMKRYGINSEKIFRYCQV